jgi:hypothetical protein
MTELEIVELFFGTSFIIFSLLIVGDTAVQTELEPSSRRFATSGRMKF